MKYTTHVRVTYSSLSRFIPKFLIPKRCMIQFTRKNSQYRVKISLNQVRYLGKAKAVDFYYIRDLLLFTMVRFYGGNSKSFTGDNRKIKV